MAFSHILAYVHRIPAACFPVFWLLLLTPVAVQAQPAIEGYRDYAALQAELESIATSDVASLSSLGQTLGGREVYLLTLSIGEPDTKPALLVVGNVWAPHLAGSELAVRLARSLVDRATTDERVKQLLTEQTVYVFPRPTPDASEAFFQRPSYERSGNVRATDDDRDGDSGEDPPDDLNGDGLITKMRIEDPVGEFFPHPDDPRVLIEADREEDERGKFRVLMEGIDDDGDERFNEDGPGGVDFNRNFTFRYPYFKSGAGPHQVSEPETRAVADFAFAHSNIYGVLTFSPHDNLARPWKPNSGSESARIKTAVRDADAAYYEAIGKKYRAAVGMEDPPDSPSDEGSFAHWAYFHYGRWSLAARGWWIPKAEEETEAEAQEPGSGQDSEVPQADGAEVEPAQADEKPGEEVKPETSENEESKKDKRGADELNALRWLDREGIDGFVTWTEVEHPDFPDKKVEVGGFRPFVLLNPPAPRLDELAAQHADFLLDFAGMRPRLEVADTQVEPLGEGVHRVKVTLRNTGFLPTMSTMGATSRQLVRLEAKIELPDGARLVTGAPRVPIKPLDGAGGHVNLEWLVFAPGATKATDRAQNQAEPAPRPSEKKAENNSGIGITKVRVHAGSPTLGTVKTTIELR